MTPGLLRHILAAFLMALGLAGAARGAQDWLPVGETDELQDYLDSASVARHGDRVSAWFLDNFFVAQDASERDKTYMSRKSHLHFDCREGLFAVEEVVLFNRLNGEGRVTGKTPRRRTSDLKFEPVPDGSLLADMMDLACDFDEGEDTSPVPTIRI